MDIYLQPQEDGLPTRPSGRWAAEKLDYLSRYVEMFETSMRDRWSVRCYIDLLAGPGKNRVCDSGMILLGSPLIALKTTYPFTNYFFSDREQQNTDALRQRCAVSPNYSRVDIQTGDCNELVNDVVERIRDDSRRSLNLAFLDPEGVKEVRWETVARLASLQRMDLIINYPEGGLNRNLPLECVKDEETAIDLFFGDRKWRAIYDDCSKKQSLVGVHRLLIDHYQEKLRALGYIVKEVSGGDETGTEPLIRNVEKNAPLYRLLYASKHKLGHDFWKKVTRRDVHGQVRLF